MIEIVDVAGFKVADIKLKELLANVRNAMLRDSARPSTFFGLHVGGLNKWRSHEFIRAINSATLTYGDGVSVVSLAKAAGATKIEKLSTTDTGIPMLRAAQAAAGSSLRIAVIGGPPGRAGRAGEVIEQEVHSKVVYATHGFHDDYAPVLDELRQSAPDVLIVGMGMPTEAYWVLHNIDSMPGVRMVMTCGGWLGFLTSEERRAPAMIRRCEAEWLWRLLQQPRSHAKRYLCGAVTYVTLLASIVGRRLTLKLAVDGSSQGRGQ